MGFDSDIILEGILYFIGENKKINSDTERIHKTIYNLKKKYRGLLREFIFDMDRPFPYCEDIDFVINNLMAANLLGISGPYLEGYKIMPELIKHFEGNPDIDLTKEQLSNLEKLSKEFYREIKV